MTIAYDTNNEAFRAGKKAVRTNNYKQFSHIANRLAVFDPLTARDLSIHAIDAIATLTSNASYRCRRNAIKPANSPAARLLVTATQTLVKVATKTTVDYPTVERSMQALRTAYNLCSYVGQCDLALSAYEVRTLLRKRYTPENNTNIISATV